MTASAEVFAGEVTSVVDARRFATTVTAGIAPSLADVVVVLVSELATNAVVHGATDYTVRIDVLADGGVRLAVVDLGPGQPTVQHPDLHELHGRGLQIVKALADDWGVLPGPGGRGKEVWAVLRTRR